MNAIVAFAQSQRSITINNKNNTADDDDDDTIFLSLFLMPLIVVYARTNDTIVHEDTL